VDSGSVHASKVMGPHIPLQARGLVEASYAASTWARHASAMNCLEKFGYIRGVKIMYPVPLEILCDFVSWALLEKGLKADTLKAYLSSINVVHNFRGLNSHCSNGIITSMLKGAKNMSLYEGLARGTRKVMSYPLMRLLQHQIFNSEWSDDSKLVVWAASLTAYFGSFRLGEILPKSENYNVEETLMWGDVKFRNEDSVLIHVEVDKCKNVAGSYIDLFMSDMLPMCPVKTLLRLKASRVGSKLPVFSFANGKMLTANCLVNTIRKLLEPVIGKYANMLCGHSFRACIPSALAANHNAVSDIDIKNWGRWTSDSYLVYTRLKLKQKSALYSKILKVLNKSL
jgi:hypothetical protein